MGDANKVDQGGRERTACKKKMIECDLLSSQYVTERKGSGAVAICLFGLPQVCAWEKEKSHFLDNNRYSSLSLYYSSVNYSLLKVNCKRNLNPYQ